MPIQDFIRGLPKAELHMHIEGSLEPELMFEIARRNGVLLRFDSVETVRRAFGWEADADAGAAPSNTQDLLVGKHLVDQLGQARR